MTMREEKRNSTRKSIRRGRARSIAVDYVELKDQSWPDELKGAAEREDEVFALNDEEPPPPLPGNRDAPSGYQSAVRPVVPAEEVFIQIPPPCAMPPVILRGMNRYDAPPPSHIRGHSWALGGRALPLVLQGAARPVGAASTGGTPEMTAARHDTADAYAPSISSIRSKWNVGQRIWTPYAC